MNTLCDSDTNYYFYNKKNIYKAPPFLDIPTPYIYPLPRHPLDMLDFWIFTAYNVDCVDVFYIRLHIRFCFISNFHLNTTPNTFYRAQKSPRVRRLVVVNEVITMEA